MVVVRVVDRAGKAMGGYHVHYGQDGGWDRWDTLPTSDVFKDPFGYNSAYSFSTEGGLKIYVSVFREEIHPFDLTQSLSAPGEVTVNIDPKDNQACLDSGNKTDGTAVRIAPVIFTYNR